MASITPAHVTQVGGDGGVAPQGPLILKVETATWAFLKIDMEHRA